MFHCCIEKIESHLETCSNAQSINLTFVPHTFVANFISYIYAKYYSNWFKKIHPKTFIITMWNENLNKKQLL